MTYNPLTKQEEADLRADMAAGDNWDPDEWGGPDQLAGRLLATISAVRDCPQCGHERHGCTGYCLCLNPEPGSSREKTLAERVR